MGSRRLYTELAAALKKEKAPKVVLGAYEYNAGVANAALAVAGVLRDLDPSFDHARFIANCGQVS